MHPLSPIELTLAALLLEAMIGYPAFVYRVIGHPVTWIGGLLTWLETRLNRPAGSDGRRRVLGVATLAIVLAAASGAALLLQRLLPAGPVGACLLVLVSTSLLAQRSLHQHVQAVADALRDGGLDAGRAAVAMIVGRNPALLDEAGVARAAIESLAENFSDGVVAPAFWMAVGGLPGAVAYKAVNTADSMIGHRTPRYAAFGWAAARLDDLVNLPASRLAAVLLMAGACLTGGLPRAALSAVVRDAKRHRSPNAGWPEAAMAGALGLRLAGPRVYGDTLVDDAFMGEGRADASADDIRRALRVYRAACAVQAIALLGVVLIWRG
jgi:adenosylcobinamide-phosphate synthase